MKGLAPGPRQPVSWAEHGLGAGLRKTWGGWLTENPTQSRKPALSRAASKGM